MKQPFNNRPRDAVGTDGILKSGKPSRSNLSRIISIRLTVEELAELKLKACRLSLSEYVRRRLFAENATALSSSGDEYHRPSPQARQKLLVQILTRLGQLDSIKNINLLIQALQSGLFGTSPETIAALNALHKEIQAVRRDLLKALGLRP